MKTSHEKFIGIFDKDGDEILIPIDCDTLEDATIWASNYADDNEYELLSVDYNE